MKPFKALLVEGTSGVGKSTLIDRLIRRHVEGAQERKIRTVVHLAQSHTYGPLALAEDAGALTVEENQRHLERIVGMIEWLYAGVQEHDKAWCFVVVDTLHLTHCVRPGVVTWSDVENFDRRLATDGRAIHSRVREEVWAKSRGDPSILFEGAGNDWGVVWPIGDGQANDTERRRIGKQCRGRIWILDAGAKRRGRGGRGKTHR